MPHNEKTQAEWEAESDADTLVRAEEIKADPQRLSAAQQIADNMADEQREKARHLDKIASNPDSPAPGNGSDNPGPRSTGGTGSLFVPPNLL